MKLRLTNGSIRLRLSESDTEAWKQGGMIQETVLLSPDCRFIYRLERTLSGHDIEAHLADGLLLLTVPEDTARQWLESAEEGLQSHRNSSFGAVISIERDLPCKHGQPGP